jgi:hydrogenase maturation protein HypF
LQASDVAWDGDLPPVSACDADELAAVRSQLASRRGSVASSSMGRLFDGVAALLGVRQRIGYEAQAAIELEILAAGATESVAPPWAFDVHDGVLDYVPVVRGLVAGIRSGVDVASLAYWFHAAVANAVAVLAADICTSRGHDTVGLTGGVFQNVLLLDLCRRRLEEHALRVLVHGVVPPNDGGLALGQAVIGAVAHARRQEATR